MKNFAFYAKAQPSIGIAKIVFNHLLSRYPNERFGDVCETTSGGTPNRGNADFYNGNIPWLKSGELNDGLITSFEETITDLGLKNSSAKIFPKDTLLVAMYGATAGKTGVLNFDAATNQAVCAVFPGERIQRDFVFWYLKQQRVDFIEISRGGAQPNISQTVIKNAVIPCPSIEVQETVVAFLDKVDAGNTYQIPDSLQAISREVDNLLLIRNRFEAANSELKSQTDYLTQLRQALLREAMQGQLLPQDPTDEPAAVLLQQLQAAAKPGKKGRGQAGSLFTEAVEGPFAIPASWAWSELGEVSAFYNGDRSSSYPSGADIVSEGIPFISTKNIVGSNINLDASQLNFITKEKFLSLSGGKLKDGDLVMCLRGSVGKAGLFRESEDFNTGFINAQLVIIRPAGAILSDFLLIILSNKFFQNQVISKTSGSAQPQIAAANLKTALVPLPPLAEQHRIVAKLEQLLGHCDALEQRIRESRRLAEQLLATALREALAPPAGTEPALAPATLAFEEAATPRRRGRPAQQSAAPLFEGLSA